MTYDRKEALRYFGAKEESKEVENLLDATYLKIRNAILPRYCYKKFSLKSDTATGESFLGEDTVFHSKNLARHLANCTEVFLFGATLGSSADSAVRKVSIESIAQGGAAQAICAAMIESFCNESCKEIGKTLPQGLYLLPRFSPGYGDWPLEEQKTLFRLLGCEKSIGLTLTDSLMMAPTKSVTAIIGITKEDKCAKNKCASCTKLDCEFRH